MEDQERKKIIKVGTPKEGGISNKKKSLYSWKDVTYDADGWADASQYFPEDYYLVFLRIKRGKTMPGWCDGFSFHGLRLKKEDQVISWKRKEGLDD